MKGRTGWRAWILTAAVLVGLIEFAGACSSGKSSPKSSGPDAADNQELCYDAESNWLAFVIGTSSSNYMTTSLLNSMPSRQHEFADYVRKHHHPSELTEDVDNAQKGFAQTYSGLVRTEPKPDPTNQHDTQLYTTQLYLKSWKPMSILLGAKCSAHDTNLQKKIAAVPSPVPTGSRNGFALPNR